MANERFQTVKFKDWVEARVFDEFGDVKQIHIADDLITNAGMAAVASLMISGTTIVSTFNYIAIGSGATAAATDNTVLDQELIRAEATSSRVTTGVANDTAQLVYQFASGKPAGLNGVSTGANKDIVESGVFSEATVGSLLCRQTFASLNIDWDGGDTLQITWKVQVS